MPPDNISNSNLHAVQVHLQEVLSSESSATGELDMQVQWTISVLQNLKDVTQCTVQLREILQILIFSVMHLHHKVN